MDVSKIERITIVSQAGVSQSEVGVDGVAEILDNSIEFESSILSIYTVHDAKGNVLKRIENCPVEIRYEPKK